ncbi:hypothetical protein ABK040_016765 [Willaertia magna]
MSQITSTLPKTRGKVVLVTECGDIEIELFSREAPKTCKNFVQLCLEGFYNNQIFHRIINEQFIQSGDPTGQGNYGESIYEEGKAFEAEYHSRLKFIQRGIVACAAQNNLCDSRFFITLNKLEPLNFKHTIFGQVIGDTMFNVMKIAELEVDEKDRPVYPPKILKVDVIVNPFPDIIPRKKKLIKGGDEGKKRKAKKDLNLLSFADDLEDFKEEDKNKKKKISEEKFENLKEEDIKEEVKVSSSSNTDISESKEEIAENMIDTDLKEENLIDYSAVEEKFKSLKKAIDERKEELNTKSKQEAKSYLEIQKQKYQKKKDKKQRQEEALQKFQSFKQNLKNTNSSWKSHSLKFKSNKKDNGDDYETIE